MTEAQKHLLEAGVLVGGGVALWWLLRQEGTATPTYTPAYQYQQLGYPAAGYTQPPGVGTNYPVNGGPAEPNGVNIPGVGQVGSGPAAAATPLNLPTPVTQVGGTYIGPTSAATGGTNITSNVGGITTNNNCGCCTNPPAWGNGIILQPPPITYNNGGTGLTVVGPPNYGGYPLGGGPLTGYPGPSSYTAPIYSGG